VTWLDVILYGPGWLACLMFPAMPFIDRWHYRRTCRRYKERWGRPYPGP
jgi:hypothetical protein